MKGDNLSRKETRKELQAKMSASGFLPGFTLESKEDTLLFLLKVW